MLSTGRTPTPSSVHVRGGQWSHCNRHRRVGWNFSIPKPTGNCRPVSIRTGIRSGEYIAYSVKQNQSRSFYSWEGRNDDVSRYVTYRRRSVVVGWFSYYRYPVPYRTVRLLLPLRTFRSCYGRYRLPFRFTLPVYRSVYRFRLPGTRNRLPVSFTFRFRLPGSGEPKGKVTRFPSVP